ncbi:MAG: tRNA preQ1(34) S-adenosylmethionine ribosyltransferase-isomerase QueA [Calditrichaeota bacterium]|nr:MAG: tRNA preQ1(34) S-adenosylmethionine ribosyltransferase-isomerase QueA [Calditrichota bacterium]
MKTNLRLSDFVYELPENLIAKTPASPRDSAKLLVLDKNQKTIEHKIFKDLTDFLEKGDVLIVNETKVLPARLIGKKTDTGGKIEFFLLEEISPNLWKVLSKPAKRAKVGTKFVFGKNELFGKVKEVLEGAERVVEFSSELNFWEALEKVGKTPLPPYIKREVDENDKNEYQTVYAKNLGAVAAPTAGLHFTDRLLEEIKAKGIEILPLTLHVGAGTFKPVSAENIEEHKMHTEYFEIPKHTAEKVLECRKRGNKIFAVGTTSVRTLESATEIVNKELTFKILSGKTDIFIFPPYKFKAVDGLITNFHLPHSTLLMLVSALSTRDFMIKAYETAVQEDYRFYSYGDAMLIF